MKIQIDPSFGRRDCRNFLASGLPVIVTFGVIWWKLANNPAFNPTALSLCCLVVGFVQLMISRELLLRRYHCPMCGERLKKRIELDGQNLSYPCSGCQIDWRVWIGYKSKGRVLKEMHKLEKRV